MDTRQQAHQFKILASVLMAAPVVILLALSAILVDFPGGLLGDPNPLLVVAVIAAGLGAHFICDRFLYRMAPVPTGLDRDKAINHALMQNQSKTIARFTICDAVFIVCVALAFVIPQGGFLLVITGFLVTETLLFIHLWPREAVITRTESALEAGGAKAYLREIYAFAPWTGPAHMAPGTPITDEAPSFAPADDVIEKLESVVLTKPTNTTCTCGADLPTNAQFCPTCGTATSAR